MTTAFDLVSIDYSFWMKRALKLAAGGLGLTQPNPMVGAIVLDAAGEVAGSGYHARAGEAHAESVALAEAGPRASGGTLIVTLEPCCHQGRTPPCTDAIIGSGIKRVVSTHQDPDPRVAGEGFRQLERAGIEVTTGIETEPSERLNRHYLHHRRTGLPWVTLKLAASLDGRTTDAAGRSQWITSEACRRHAWGLRGLHDAILVGAETARRDDPTLLLHDAPGRPPRRFVLEGRRELPRELRLFSGASPATAIGTARSASADWKMAEDSRGWPDARSVAIRMGSEGITALLVEGGSRVAASFLSAGVVCRLVVYYAPLLLGEGQSLLAGVAFPLETAPKLREVEREDLEGGWVVSGLLEMN